MAICTRPRPQLAWVSMLRRRGQGAGSGQVVHLVRGDARVEVDDRIAHRQAPEGLAEVVGRALVDQGGGPEHGLGHAAEQVLGEVHEVAVIGVGLVELHHGEFRVVAGGEPLVPEVAVDLVDPLEAADHQALEVQLRGDAQVELHVQGVVVGDEGPRRRPARDDVHHRASRPPG